MSEKNFYNNYEYQDEYEMRCQCKYDYEDDGKKTDPCECIPENNCCNGVTFDDPIVNKDVIISTNEVFDNKLTCSIPVTASIAAVSTSTAVTIITQRYVPIEECGCKSCDPLTIDASAIYKVERVTVKITKLFVSQATAAGKILINDEENPKFLTPDINTDIYKVSFLGFPSVFKNTCDNRCKGSKSSITLQGLVFPYTPVVEMCGTVTSCGRKAKFFITIQLPQRYTPGITSYIPEVCVPSLEAFEKPYLELSGRAEATVLGKPTITVKSPSSATQCLPKLGISVISFLLRGVVQSKVVVPVQRLIQSKGLFIPDNFEQCCNIPNVYPSQVEDNC